MSSQASYATGHGQLLYLNAEEQSNTHLVIENFFDCYDLQEVHDILWSWMSEAITSHRSIADEPHKRKDILSFFENISALVEASFLIDSNSKQAATPVGKKKKKKNK